jgi:hypothetical protein
MAHLQGGMLIFAYNIDHGAHLSRMPTEPLNDTQAVLNERNAAIRYLRDNHQWKAVSDIEAGKHIPDGE